MLGNMYVPVRVTFGYGDLVFGVYGDSHACMHGTSEIAWISREIHLPISPVVQMTSLLASSCSNFEMFDHEHLIVSTIRLVVPLSKSTMLMNTVLYI